MTSNSLRLDRVWRALAAREPWQSGDVARREAAVALLLRPDPDRMLLVRRAIHPGDPWSGQLALPGGRREPEDADLLATAIRETSEEIGVMLRRDEMRATLDDLAPVASVLPPIVVRPFVFRLDRDVTTGLNGEIDEAAWVELATLADPAVRRADEQMVQGVPRRVIGYHLPLGLLWGMTERIVTPVVAAWLAAGD